MHLMCELKRTASHTFNDESMLRYLLQPNENEGDSENERERENQSPTGITRKISGPE